MKAGQMSDEQIVAILQEADSRSLQGKRCQLKHLLFLAEEVWWHPDRRSQATAGIGERKCAIEAFVGGA